MKNDFICYPDSASEKIGFQTVRSAVRHDLYTPNGRTLLEQLEPTGDAGEVDIRCTQTAEMVRLLDEDQSPPLTQVDEIEQWLELSKAEDSMLSLAAFPVVRAHARLARLLHSFFERQSENVPELWRIAGNLQPLKNLEKQIDRVLTDQGELRNDASPKLASIRSSLKNKRNQLRSTIEKLFKKAARDGIASDEGPTIRNGRMVIPIQAEFKRKIEGFVHDISSSGQTVFLEPAEALQVNNDIRQLEAEEVRETERILRALTGEVRTYRKELKQNAEWIGKIDLVHAKARLGRSWDGVLPERTSDRQWTVTKALNPILLLKNRKLNPDDREEIVPLNFEIEGDEKGIVISGPNAGGKSVALKTIGLLSMMVQSGIPLPAGDSSRFPVISGIFLDMGDDQSIESDLSTFSSRLQWMQKTLDMIDEYSLVLIDEAGTGTDPEEGGALFQAFIEQVLDSGSHLVATTHHGALKVFANDHPHLVNGAMEFDQETLAPTYRFRKGIPGSSYAFEIAARMHLPDSLLNRSRSLLGEQRERMAELLLNLEQRLQEAETAQKRYESLQQEADKKEKIFRSKSNELDQKRQKTLKEAYREAEKIMQDANRKIEEAVEKIVTEGKENRQQIREARREVAGHKKKIRRELKESAQTTGDLDKEQLPKVGDQVSITGSNTTGELIEVEGDSAVVQAGGLKIKTGFGKLKKADVSDKKGRGKKKSWSSSSDKTNYTPKQVGTSLDLRGMRGDDAVRELMLYLDQAVASGLSEVDIIHGKGEGILKKLTHEYLVKRSEVSHFETAPWDRGGPGCTVVRLH